MCDGSHTQSSQMLLWHVCADCGAPGCGRGYVSLKHALKIVDAVYSSGHVFVCTCVCVCFMFLELCALNN